MIFPDWGTTPDTAPEEALRYVETACEMAPGNAEYRPALERLSGREDGYRAAGYGPIVTGCDGSPCMQLACTYCLCSSCGGPIICC